MKKKSGSGFRRAVLAIFGDERRQSITIPVFAVVLSLLASAVMLLALGKDPINAFLGMLRGCGIVPKANYAAKTGMLTDFMSFLNVLAPMIFAALAVAVASKTGLFNIGISGQMLFAGFIATVVVGYSDLPAAAALPLVIVIGVAAGALVGGIIGFLKYRFNINEVVSSIMLNYIIQYVVSFFINMYYVDPVSRQSMYISNASRLTITGVEIFGMKADLPLAMLLVPPAIIFAKVLFDRTKIGYEMKSVGLSRNAARYAGMSVGKNMVLSMLVSGALAGLAGVAYYLGYFNSIQPGVLTSVGFDSIAVSILGNYNPLGIFFSSFLITIVSKGSTYMSSSAAIPQEIASIITGLILVVSACTFFIRTKLARMSERELESRKAAKAAATPDEPVPAADDSKGGER